MGTLADLVGGYQQGALFKEQMTSAGEKRQDRRRENEGRRRALEVEMGGQYTPELGSLYDPYEWNLGKMFRGLFGGDTRQQQRNETALGSRDLGTEISRMADGGPVEDEWNPPREALRSVGNVVGRGVRGAFPRLREEMAEAGTAIPAAVEGFGDASARDRGRMIRNAALETGSAVGEYAGAAAEDILAPAKPLAEGALGFLGFTGERQGSPAAASDEHAAAITAQAPTEESAPAGPPSAGGGAATPQSGPSPFVGPPEPEQAAAQLGNVDIMPDDMPSMGTQEWISYRQEMVPALMMQGASAQEAHEQVTALQHQGFLRYGQQAAMMLQAGNQEGAARALKAAYQYFPNGTDVKFGFQNGHLVSLGLDEATGEPKGKPQVITPEYLAAQLTNFQDPSKFLAWTNDWRDDSFREREYQEVTRPAAESSAQYRDRAGQAAMLNAGAAYQRAANAGTTGGRDQTDFDRAFDDFKEATAMIGLDSEDDADLLNSVMSQIYTRVDWQPAEVIEFVKRAHSEGRIQDIMEQLGLR